MGFRVRQSGGFWNGVDGVFTGVRFSNTTSTGKGTGKVYGVVGFRQDGKQTDETRHFALGDLDTEWTISEDGYTATNVNGDSSPTWELGQLLDSFFAALQAAGIPEEGILPDVQAGAPLNLQGIAGVRARLEQAPALDKDGNPKKRKATKGRFAGKEFNDTRTIVTKVYGRVETAKGTTSAARTAASKGNGAAASVDISQRASDIVLTLVAEAEAKKKPLTKNGLNVPVLRITTEDATLKEFRDEIRKLAFSDEFLARIPGIKYDLASGALSLES